MLQRLFTLMITGMLLGRSGVSATDWYIDNPVEDDVFEAGDDINADGAGPADADFTLKIYVAGALIKSESCTVGSEDYWSESVEAPMGGWTNATSSVPGHLKIYEGHGNGALLQDVTVEFYAAGGQA